MSRSDRSWPHARAAEFWTRDLGWTETAGAIAALIWSAIAWSSADPFSTPAWEWVATFGSDTHWEVKALLIGGVQLIAILSGVLWARAVAAPVASWFYGIVGLSVWSSDHHALSVAFYVVFALSNGRVTYRLWVPWLREEVLPWLERRHGR